MGSKGGKLGLWEQLAGASAEEWMAAAEREVDVVLQQFCRAHAAAAYRLEDAMQEAEEDGLSEEQHRQRPCWAPGHPDE